MTQEIHPVKIKETSTKFRALQCIRLLGDLSVHLSGEARVMFKTRDDETYVTYYGVTLSGDQGCVDRLDEAPCAVDELAKIFTRFEPWMYQNDEMQEHYITEEFKIWLNETVPKIIFDSLREERVEKVTCEFYPKGEIDPIAVITVTALSNPFAIALYEETEGIKYIGEVIAYGEIVGEGKRYNLTVKNKKAENVIEIDLTEPFLMVGITDIEKVRYLYLDKKNDPVLSPVLLHGKKRGLVITHVFRAEK